MASRTAAGVAPNKIPRSAAAVGSHYKLRTVRWLEKQGYVVAYMERMMWIRTGEVCPACQQPRTFPAKKDQMGADLLAVRADRPVTFVQVKLHRDHLAAARREFARFPFPEMALRWIVIWERRAHQPEIVVCADRPGDPIPRTPRTPKETLF